MNLETSPELELDEAMFSRSKSYSIIIKTTDLKAKHKRREEHSKYTLEHYKNCLEKNEIIYGIFHSFRCRKHQISMVKQSKIALITFDDKRCYINKHKRTMALRSSQVNKGARWFSQNH